MMEIEKNGTKSNRNEETNIPWVEKYRPQDLSNLIGHKHTVKTIRKFINENNLPNLLFYGPPGTGKTSTMIACAKEMYKTEYKLMVLELNASDSRGINVVRNMIKGFAETRSPIHSAFNCKIVILDEADSMTRDAQAALRRIMEKYSRSTRFCLICNYVNKIIPALQSRCTKFKFKQIPVEHASSRVKEICEAEGIEVDSQAVEDIIRLSEGDMRRVVNMLQSIHITLRSKSRDDTEGLVITRDFIYAMTGFPHPKFIQQILEILTTCDNLGKAYEEIGGMMKERGVSLASLLKTLTNRLLDFDMNGEMRGRILVRLAEIEYRLSLGCRDDKHIASMIGAFVEARHVGS